ncbi:hypothetical protein [Pseudomonas aeruginosa]|uniref:hypothetical protein n=1 Tax=Pseudomonas aeruginosa TaxID=287 RepID=UPI002454667D|nr:hypothetical protein [Pseudomonas aeruginosa]MDH4704205.1 hypothetical protein [Pseudomonas aeruginosa]
MSDYNFVITIPFISQLRRGSGRYSDELLDLIGPNVTEFDNDQRFLLTAEQFGTFIYLRDKAGLQNTIKNLCITRVPRGKRLDKDIIDRTRVDLTQDEAVNTALPQPELEVRDTNLVDVAKHLAQVRTMLARYANGAPTTPRIDGVPVDLADAVTALERKRESLRHLIGLELGFVRAHLAMTTTDED